MMNEDNQFDLFLPENAKKIAISGASGMIGSFLREYFLKRGFVVLSIPKAVIKNTKQLKKMLVSADVIINLAGVNIGHGRWSKEKTGLIYQSRIETTKKIVSVLNEDDMDSKILISTSAVGYYGANCGEVEGEDAPSGNDYLATVCRDWELAANSYAKGRVITPRFGVVLSKDGGFLQKMISLAKYNILGLIGDGHTRMSWIALEDLANLMYYLCETNQINGAVNFTTSYPFTNKELVFNLCQHLHKRVFIPTPTWAIRLLFGEKGKELILVDQSVAPRKLSQSAYAFQFNRLSEYLTYAIGE